MSITGKLLRGTAFMSGANFLARAGTFLGNLAVIRVLDVESVGELGLIESWLNLLTALAALGISAATARYVAAYLESDRERSGAMVGGGLFLATLTSAGAGLLTYLFLTLPLGLELGPEGGAMGVTTEILAGFAPVLACLVTLYTIRQTVTAVAYGLQNFQVFVWLNLIVGVLSFPVSYLMVVWLGLLGVLWARLLLAVVELVLLALAVSRTLLTMRIRVSFAGLGKNSVQLLSFGLPTFAAQVIANPVQPVMMSLLATQPGGIAQVALLTTAQRLVSLVGFFTTAMASSMMPVLSTEWGRDNVEGFRHGIWVSLRMLWSMSMPFALVFMAASPALLGWLYGAEYIPAWPLAFLLLSVSLLTSINHSADQSLAAANRQWLSTANNLAWAVMFFSLAVWLIPGNLSLGYAAAYLMSFALYVLLQLAWLRRLFQVSMRSLPLLAGLTMLLVLVAWGVAARLGFWPQVVAAGVLGGGAILVEWRWFLTAAERRGVGYQVQRAVAKARLLPARLLSGARRHSERREL